MNEGAYQLPVMETVKAAWAKVHGAKGSFWAVIFIFFIIQIVLGLIGGLGAKEGALNIIVSIISWIVQIAASACLMYLGIRRAQDMPITYKMMKDVLTASIILCMIGFLILKIIVLIPAGILGGIGAYLASVIQMQPEPSNALRLVDALVFIATFILFVYLSARIWLGWGAIVDKKLNPLEALKLAFRASKGNVWNLVGLYIITLLISLVCVITLGIGFIWGLPWLLIIYGEAYNRLSSRPVA